MQEKGRCVVDDNYTAKILEVVYSFGFGFTTTDTVRN